MQQVYLGLGSNIDPERNIAAGIDALGEQVGPLSLSSCYLNPAVGFRGAAFINLVVGLRTSLPLAELAVVLRQLEVEFGRTADCKKNSSRHLDIDILTYGNSLGQHSGIQLPRSETTCAAYVLAPFAELAPDLVLPGQELTLRQLWLQFPKSGLNLERISLDNYALSVG